MLSLRVLHAPSQSLPVKSSWRLSTYPATHTEARGLFLNVDMGYIINIFYRPIASLRTSAVHQESASG